IKSIANAQIPWFRPIVKLWHGRAYPVIGTKPFEETWADFIRAYPKVQFPIGEDPMTEIFAIAEASEPPSCAVDYEWIVTIRLIKLCRELQRAAGDKPFHLACRIAGEL